MPNILASPTLPLLLTAAFASWALWQRRSTWHFRYETGPTANILLQTLALLLCAPASSNTFGALLHEATDLWHLDDYSGHCCSLVAAAIILYAAIRRLVSDEDLNPMFVRRYAWAVGGAIPLMFICLQYSRAAQSDLVNDDMMRIEPDAALVTYWSLYLGALLYLFGVTFYALRIVRRDDQSREVANLWMAAVGLAVAACLSGLANAHSPLSLNLPVWLFACATTCLFAAAAVKGWRERIGPWRDLLLATSQRASL